MGTEINIFLEGSITLLLFATFWLLFCELYSQPKPVKILLILCMVSFRPVWTFVIYFVRLPIVEVLLPVAMLAGLTALAGGKLKSIWIMAAYFAGTYAFVDAIVSAIFLGLGSFGFSVRTLYILGNASVYVVVFLVALIYYFTIRNTTEEDLKRIPLSVRLVILLMQPVALVLFYIPVSSLLKQLDAGYNNFLFLGSFFLILLVLSLIILRLFVKLVSGYKGVSSGFIEEHGLTEREVEIIKSVLEGKSNREIADLLYIAVPTVKTHLQTIYQKTGVSNRYALMALTHTPKNAKSY
jgi:DNA-binding CsgD family transcriptional regulator